MACEDEADPPSAVEAIDVAAIVVMVTVNATGEVPLTLTLAGEIEQLACAGAPLHVRLTEPVKPSAGFSCKLYVAVCPPVTVAEVEPPAPGPNEKSGGSSSLNTVPAPAEPPKYVVP